MPRANKNCCEEDVKKNLKQFGHVKCSHDRNPRDKEGKWLNHVMGEKIFEEEKCIEFVTVL